eukprot:5305532-Pyramimonas_sp.AAC.5
MESAAARESTIDRTRMSASWASRWMELLLYKESFMMDRFIGQRHAQITAPWMCTGWYIELRCRGSPPPPLQWQSAPALSGISSDRTCHDHTLKRT